MARLRGVGGFRLRRGCTPSYGPGDESGDHEAVRGSVENEEAIKPECITSSRGLEAVWRAWQVEGDVPQVDFTRDIVVAVYSVGSRLNLAGATLDDSGNLTVLGFGTRDIRPG